jgi:hypothetical protein
MVKRIICSCRTCSRWESHPLGRPNEYRKGRFLPPSTVRKHEIQPPKRTNVQNNEERVTEHENVM